MLKNNLNPKMLDKYVKRIPIRKGDVKSSLATGMEFFYGSVGGLVGFVFAFLFNLQLPQDSFAFAPFMLLLYVVAVVAGLAVGWVFGYVMSKTNDKK